MIGIQQLRLLLEQRIRLLEVRGLRLQLSRSRAEPSGSQTRRVRRSRHIATSMKSLTKLFAIR
ncbi:hypothetical protein STIAU_5293 [Stigmatella aurantiaca DW4/3-1]|uniref:Uncharacterized protein n=1 Tax=Stigmatella aurantiaca (strain DW4/3-1) TaxID=378806 RepID=Q090M5_STIAD|nr:hypothetical protein STIAU_5293 [Stigmatella aurantiaca DW4/3-1]